MPARYRNLSMFCCGQLNPSYVDIPEKASWFFVFHERGADVAFTFKPQENFVYHDYYHVLCSYTVRIHECSSRT